MQHERRCGGRFSCLLHECLREADRIPTFRGTKRLCSDGVGVSTRWLRLGEHVELEERGKWFGFLLGEGTTLRIWQNRISFSARMFPIHRSWTGRSNCGKLETLVVCASPDLGIPLTDLAENIHRETRWGRCRGLLLWYHVEKENKSIGRLSMDVVRKIAEFL